MTDNIIGRNIKRILVENKAAGKSPHSQKELAAALGIARQQVGAYMNGIYCPSPSALIRIANALNVTQYDLTGTEADREIVALGRAVVLNPALRKITSMVASGNVTNEQLESLLQTIASFK